MHFQRNSINYRFFETETSKNWQWMPGVRDIISTSIVPGYFVPYRWLHATGRKAVFMLSQHSLLPFPLVHLIHWFLTLAAH